MSSLKEQYDKNVLARKEIITQMNELEEDEKVKTYIELHLKNVQLANEQKVLYKQMKVEEYTACNHIWVTTLHDYDSREGRSYNYCGCMKCGLDGRVIHMVENLGSFVECMPLEKKIMYSFMRGRYYKTGIDTKVLCDLDLAKSIYAKIKEIHPDVDDETARKYFEVALDNIRKIEVSDERKASRARRLSLNPKFNKWNAQDVRSY